MRWSYAPACCLTALLLVRCGSGGGNPGSGDATIDVVDAGDASDANAWANVPDADGSDAGAMLTCGNVSCATPANACCLELLGGEDPFYQWSCVAAGTCTGTQSIGCWGAGDCTAGDVCCRTATATTVVASCAPSCDPGGLRLCTSSTECPSGEQCLTDPGGWKVCDTPCIDGENVGAPTATASSSGTVWLAFQYTASASFTMNSIRLYTDGRAGDAGAGSVALLDSVPADASAYEPGAVLATGTVPMTNALQWDTATVSPPVSIVKGHVYFIAQLLQRPSVPTGGATAVEYDAPSLSGPWGGPYFGGAILVQTCQ